MRCRTQATGRPGEDPCFRGKWSVQGGRSEQASAGHVFLRQRTLPNGKRAGHGAGLTAATVAAAAAVLSLRRGARSRAGLRSGRLGGARHRAAAGMVGERREAVVGGGCSESPLLVFTEHLNRNPGPSVKHMAKRPALPDLTS